MATSRQSCQIDAYGGYRMAYRMSDMMAKLNPHQWLVQWQMLMSRAYGWRYAYLLHGAVTRGRNRDETSLSLLLLLKCGEVDGKGTDVRSRGEEVRCRRPGLFVARSVLTPLHRLFW
jgi:hypothetical protein